MYDPDLYDNRNPSLIGWIIEQLNSPWGRFVIVIAIIAAGAVFLAYPRDPEPEPTPTPLISSLSSPMPANTPVAEIATLTPDVSSLEETATSIVRRATEMALPATAAPFATEALAIFDVSSIEQTAAAIISRATEMAPPATSAPFPTELPSTPIAAETEQFNQNRIDELTRQLEADPRNVDFYAERANLYYEQGEYYRAAQDYSAAIELDPDNPAYYNNRANAYQGYEAYADALADYNRAIELGFSPMSWPYNNRGNVYFAQGDFERAIEDYDQALAEDPEYATAYSNRGNAYFNLAEYEQAIADFTAAIDNGYTPLEQVYDNRASAYALMGEYAKAVNDYTAAITRDPDVPSPYLGRGIAHSNLGNRTAAASDYYRWITLSETSPLKDEMLIPGSPSELQMGEGWVYYLPFQADVGDNLTVTANDRMSALFAVLGGTPGVTTVPDGGEGFVQSSIPNEVDPLMVVLDPDGNPLVGDDDSGGNLNASIQDYRLPESGVYTLVLSHAGGGSEGFIMLLLQLE